LGLGNGRSNMGHVTRQIVRSDPPQDSSALIAHTYLSISSSRWHWFAACP
jgi:hypothetical protein